VGQDGWLNTSVISIPTIDLSVIIHGTAVRAWGKSDRFYFLKFRFQKSLGYSDQGSYGCRLRLMSAFQS